MNILKTRPFALAKGLLLAGSLFATGSLSADIILMSDNYDWPSGVTAGSLIRYHSIQGGTLSPDVKYRGQNLLSYQGSALDGFVGYSDITSTSTKKVYLNLSEEDMPAGYTVLSSQLSIVTKNSSTVGFGYVDYSGVSDGGVDIQTYGQIWFLSSYSSATDTTSYALRYGSTLTGGVIASGTYTGGELTTYTILYDFATNSVISASVDGTIVVSNYDLDDISYTPDIQSIQMQFGSIRVLAGSEVGMLADDLLVAAIPEPQAALLMLPGVLILALIRRLRSR